MATPEDSENITSPTSNCIIHQISSEPDGHLISPQDYNSWQTLFEAAKLRNHVPLLEIARHLGDKEIPQIAYHRKCHSLFTMKRDLEALKRKADVSFDDEADQ